MRIMVYSEKKAEIEKIGLILTQNLIKNLLNLKKTKKNITLSLGSLSAQHLEEIMLMS